MLIAELIAPREFRLAQQEIEEPHPGEVQVRVKAVGICGSDLHSYSEGAVGDTPCQYPMVLGHEPAGPWSRRAPASTGWSPRRPRRARARPLLLPLRILPTGHHNVCANIRFLSTPGNPGFFRELVNLPIANLLPHSAGVSIERRHSRRAAGHRPALHEIRRRWGWEKPWPCSAPGPSGC